MVFPCQPHLKSELNQIISLLLKMQVFYAEFSEAGFGIDTEKQIKKWSKAKKEALINNEYEKLPNLAKKKF